MLTYISMSNYEPSKKVIEKYADLLVRYACNGGTGLKKGQTVLLSGHEETKPLFLATREAIWKAGGNVISRYIPNEDRGPSATFLLKYGKEDQLKFFPESYYKSLVDTVDQLIWIASDDPDALEGVDPKRINLAKQTLGPYMKMRRQKEQLGKLKWTICYFGNQKEAKEAGLTYKEYWRQIIKACYLDESDPVKKWKEVNNQIHSYIQKLNKMQIDSVNIKSSDIDLNIKIGEKRQWLGGRGYNLPSFEIFTSPDWRGTNGKIKFNQPLYYLGNMIKDIELEFKDGVVVKSKASQNEKHLKAMLKNKDANKLGEFSMTDKRFSRIDKFMANTLFDENFGGKYGNTHVAVGASYLETYDGDQKKVTEKQKEKLGFNQCDAVHTDMISTTNRVITATLKDGSQRVIYKDGEFTF